MPLIILLLILGLPIIELSILIDIGAEIGALPTVALCLLTAAIGLSIVRKQSIDTLRNVQQAHVSEQLVHGVFLALAGIFLLIPGFMTDFAGALFLIPAVRLGLGRSILSRMTVHQSGYARQKDVTIDAEYWEETDREVVDIEVISETKHTDNQKN